MQEAKEKTENSRKGVVQKTRIRNYGQIRYKLASALRGTSGYDLTEDFKHAVRSTSTVSVFCKILHKVSRLVGDGKFITNTVIHRGIPS